MASIRLRNGSWVADIRRKGHKSISKSFTTKAAAERWAREVESKIDALQFNDDRSLAFITLEQLIDRYVEEIGSITPFRRNKSAVLMYWKTQFGHMKLSDLNSDFLTSWVMNRIKKVKGVTAAVDLAYLGKVLMTAKELWRLPVDPYITTKARSNLKYVGVSAKSRERDRRPTIREIDDICLYFTTKVRQQVPMEPLILFAIASAMRLGEIVNLRWADLNIADRTIIIRDRKHPTEKLGNDQEVPLLGQAFDIVMSMPRIDERIFPINKETPSSLFPRACKALGIEDLRFHDLRHEGISRLFEQGYTIEQVALISGHRSWNMLSRYVQLRAKDLHRA